MPHYGPDRFDFSTATDIQPQGACASGQSKSVFVQSRRCCPMMHGFSMYVLDGPCAKCVPQFTYSISWKSVTFGVWARNRAKSRTMLGTRFIVAIRYHLALLVSALNIRAGKQFFTVFSVRDDEPAINTNHSRFWSSFHEPFLATSFATFATSDTKRVCSVTFCMTRGL